MFMHSHTQFLQVSWLALFGVPKAYFRTLVASIYSHPIRTSLSVWLAFSGARKVTWGYLLFVNVGNMYSPTSLIRLMISFLGSYNCNLGTRFGDRCAAAHPLIL